MKGQGGNRSLRRLEKQNSIDSVYGKPSNTQATLGTSASNSIVNRSNDFIRFKVKQLWRESAEHADIERSKRDRIIDDYKKVMLFNPLLPT